MTTAECLNNLDAFEVEKRYYDSYTYRLQTRQLIKTTPEKNVTIFIDTETRLPVTGFKEEDVMGMVGKNYYIFELLDEELLGPEKTYQIIHLDEQQYMEFLEELKGAIERSKK